MKAALGLDLGSVNVRAVLLDPSGHLQWSGQRSVQGRLHEALLDLLQPLDRNLRARISVTGSGRRLLTSSGVRSENEIVALGEAARRFAPEARTLIEIGGHTSRLVLLGSDGAIEDHALNEACAAGSGAFIEQQAARLQLDVAALAAAAGAAPRGAPVAGRCSVFAKSDMIHLQQKGVPLEEIAYGLCLAVARNFVATLLRGRACRVPVILLGGGAKNEGIVRAFSQILALNPPARVPPFAPFFAALGTALSTEPAQPEVSLSEVLSALEQPAQAEDSPAPLPPLAPSHRRFVPLAEPRFAGCPSQVEGHLGIDVGSVSTNLVVLGRDGEVLDGIYLATRGRPVEVLQEGLGLLQRRFGQALRVISAGTTGSGRHLAAALLGADVVQNEISCQLRSAVHYFPHADSVFEIGGQDSKFIRTEAGRLADFAMNKICAAGTGSFLEEEAQRLGIAVEREFAPLALSATDPVQLGCRCTVFMDTELVRAQAREDSVADLCAGLAYAIARNFLERVVQGRSIGDHVVMQGGVASNAAVVAAFSQLLDREIAVHPHCRISGAIGAALAAREMHQGPSAFRGLGVFEQEVRVRAFECQSCENRCQVSRVRVGDSRAHFGDACERFSAHDRARPAASPLPDLFVEREAILASSLRLPTAGRRHAAIGLPRASFLLEQLPFWTTLLDELGFAVRVSPPSSSRTLEVGSTCLPAETCLPVKLAFGHVKHLLDGGIDAVLVPSLVQLTDWRGGSASVCPFVQSLPFMLAAGMKGSILRPELTLGPDPELLVQPLLEAFASFGVAAGEIVKALRVAMAAQRGFRQRLRSRGAEVLAEARGGVRLAVLGKPYNLQDPFLNLNLGRHLHRLGALALPLDFFPDEGSLDGGWGQVPWRYSQDILRVLQALQEWPGFHPVIISSYGCGPDAFIAKHTDRLLKETTHLELEFDEHRAEAGLITRLEAFLEEIAANPPAEGRRRRPTLRTAVANDRRLFVGRRIFVPFVADHAHAIVGALRAVDLDARLLPLPDRELSVRAERCASGKECHAYALLAADLDRLAEDHQPGDVYFMPGSTIPCLIQQYGAAMQLLLDEKGVPDLELLSPDMLGYRDLFGYEGVSRLYRGLLASDLLIHALCTIRPYEVVPGASDAVHTQNLHDLAQGLASRQEERALRRCAARLRGIDVRREERRPLVGVSGDIYTRINQAANQRLFWRLEALGCEVWPSPFLVDIARYGVAEKLRRALRQRQPGSFFESGIALLWQQIIDRQVQGPLGTRGDRWEEPSFERCQELASPYIGRSSMNLLQWNVAKMVDFVHRGADGIVNAVAMNCMVGTISAAITRRIREDHEQVPLVTLAYGAAESAALETSLEAFVHQVKRRAVRRGIGHAEESRVRWYSLTARDRARKIKDAWGT